MARTKVPQDTDITPAPVFEPGNRVRSNRSRGLGTFMGYSKWRTYDGIPGSNVAFDDDLYLGEQVIDTVETSSIDLLPPSPPLAELVDLGHRIRAERRASQSVDGLLDMYFGPEFSTVDGGDDVEWAGYAPEGGESR